jgi:hypothetical protein
MSRRSKASELMEVITELRAEIAQLKTQVAEPKGHAQPNQTVEPKPEVKDQLARAVDGTNLNYRFNVRSDSLALLHRHGSPDILASRRTGSFLE